MILVDVLPRPGRVFCFGYLGRGDLRFECSRPCCDNFAVITGSEARFRSRDEIVDRVWSRWCGADPNPSLAT